MKNLPLPPLGKQAVSTAEGQAAADLSLPPECDSSGEETQFIRVPGQLTIVGANGAGKTRFMHRMMELCAPNAVSIAAIPYSLEGQLSDSAQTASSGGNPEPMTLESLGERLLHDEFRTLLRAKAEKLLYGKEMELEPTRLDALVEVWSSIFPDNQVISDAGQLLFATPGGDNLITTARLSAGERAVLYYIAAVLYAPKEATIFVDSPTVFLHPALINPLWNAVEGLRPDCTFVYATNDEDFITSRSSSTLCWVKGHDIAAGTWDYEIIPPGSVAGTDEMLLAISGARRPVLFIEGNASGSLDAKLYPLVFEEYTVRPLGSCSKVIEATRTFADLQTLHHLESHGIVDRDRRTDAEVEYLRRKNVLVPNVAEIENIFLLEEIIKTMARRRGKNPDAVAAKVRRTILGLFETMFRAQALMHTRHQMKRLLECKADARVRSIGQLERHLRELPSQLDVRSTYNGLVDQFKRMIRDADYAGVLKVFNFKPMLPESNVATMLGYRRKEDYIAGVLSALKGSGPDARRIRAAIRHCFGLTLNPGL